MANMFHYGVACSLNDASVEAPITLRGPIEQLCTEAKEIGYEGLEIQLHDPQDWDWKALRKTTESYGLQLVAFATGREMMYGHNLISDDPKVRRGAIDKLKLHIDAAQDAGTMVIVGSLRTKITDWSKADLYMGYHKEAVCELADYAKSKGVDIVIENILSYISNYLNTMKQVADFVREVRAEGHDNVGIHLDTYSMNMEDNDIARAVAYCGKELEYVHFSDTARLYPGGGNVDFKAHMNALLDLGYKGWVVTECVPLPTAYDCAKNGFDYMKAMETIVRIERGSCRF
ncbi:MAG: sugar phosphate isomerase/epimerase family protein [Eubacteriales bacterium]|jgi:sugar phosphate isomerase/epimerase